MAITLVGRLHAQQCGHETEPMLKELAWCAYKMCILHILMAMGRVFCHWLYNWLVTLQAQGIDGCWKLAADWLHQLHININITQPPLKGSWNVKGNYYNVIFLFSHICF